MSLQLMCFEINFRVEHNKFFVKTLLIGAEEVVLLEVDLEGIIIEVVLLLSA